MQKLVSTIAGLTLLVSIISSGMPRVPHAVDTANVPPPSWPHTITTDDATIVVYQPQAVAWQEYHTLEVRVAVAVTRQGAQQPIPGVLDGEPLLSAIQGTDLSLVVNTNWDVFFDPSTATYYLLDSQFWLSAPHYTGPWQPVAQLPPAFNNPPNDPHCADVKEHIPGLVIQAQDLPRIFVSTQPAELILTNGPPTFSPIRGTKLLYVTNTDSVLFQDSRDGQYYYLTSGRWFRSAHLEGPWTFATPSLPLDFARSPPDSPQGRVLVAVPGTPQAEEAVLQAQIPRQATLKRSEATVHVTYSGEPQFTSIEGTPMSYATNTSFDVIRVGDLYYACFQGAWFVSTTPKGPWQLTDRVPSEIYTIPPSNPLYHDTYVRVYSSSADDVVYGFTAGYLMGFVTAGVLAYGTGWYYPPLYLPRSRSCLLTLCLLLPGEHLPQPLPGGLRTRGDRVRPVGRRCLGWGSIQSGDGGLRPWGSRLWPQW